LRIRRVARATEKHSLSATDTLKLIEIIIFIPMPSPDRLGSFCLSLGHN